jgi:hypothetical protein
MHRFQSVVWRLILVDLSTGCRMGALLSTSQVALRYSLLWLQNTSESPGQSCNSENQYSGRNSTLSWGGPWYTADLGGTHQSGGKKAAQRLDMLGPLLNRRSGLSIRNGCCFTSSSPFSVMDYACPIRMSAFRSHVPWLQEMQSKCHRIATNAP